MDTANPARLGAEEFPPEIEHRSLAWLGMNWRIGSQPSRACDQCFSYYRAMPLAARK
jgi:hypothetical protein